MLRRANGDRGVAQKFWSVKFVGLVNRRIPRIRVGAIIVSDAQILLVKHVKPHGSYWLLPGGGVEPGETLPEALRRELREEACVDIEPGHPCMLVDSIMPGGGRHIVNIHFTARILSGRPRLGIDETVSEVAFLPLEELGEITLYPDVATEILDIVRNGRSDDALRYVAANWKD